MIKKIKNLMQIDKAGNIIIGKKRISLVPIGKSAKPIISENKNHTEVRYLSRDILTVYKVSKKEETHKIDVTVKNLSKKIFEGELIRIESPEKYIIIPNRNGELIKNPKKNLPEKLLSISYPGSLSMPWVDVDGLCIFNEDNDRESLDIIIGKRNKKPVLNIGKRLYLDKNNTKRFTFTITPHKGDINSLIRILKPLYSTFEKKIISRIKSPDWITDIDGMVQVPVKDWKGNLISRYEDIPKLGELYQDFIGKDIIVHAFGWNGSKPFFNTRNLDGAHDDNYPYYGANESLGGEVTLKKAIKQAKDKGMHISLYTNGRIASKELINKTFRQLGSKSKKKLKSSIILGKNNKPVFEKYNNREFYLLCSGAKEWQDLVASNLRFIKSLGAELVELDQIGFQEPEPCFNKLHKHKQNQWGRNYHSLLKKIRNIGIFPWVEGIVDCYQDSLPGYQPVNLFLEHKPTFWDKSHKKYKHTKEFNHGMISYNRRNEIIPILNSLFPYLICFQGPVSDPDHRWKKSTFNSIIKDLKIRLGKSCTVPGIIDYGGGPFQLLYSMIEIKKTSTPAEQILDYYKKNKESKKIKRLKNLLKSITDMRKPYLDILIQPDSFDIIEWENTHKITRFRKGSRELVVAVNHTNKTVKRKGILLRPLSDKNMGWIKMKYRKLYK